MSNYAIILVLFSAFAHSSWNFLVKRSDNPSFSVIGLSFFSLAVNIGISFLFGVVESIDSRAWPYMISTVVIHAIYFVLLGKAYRYSDLSSVYPIARGIGLAGVPILASIFTDDIVSIQGIFGILLILIGVMLVGVFDKGSLGSLKQLFSFLDMSQKNISRGLMFSLGTGLVISTYSIIDSVAVSLMNPLLYMNFVFGGGIFGVIFLIWRKEYNLSSIKTEMYSSWKLFLIGGICSCFAYILVLQAYTLSQVSYVAPFREIGVVFGVLLGYIVLREKISYIKVLGVGSILVGAVIISLS